MSTFTLFVLHVFTLLSTLGTGKVIARIGEKYVFSATEEGFQLDGKKFNVYAGEVHYFRIAACGWEDRLRKLQRAGLNTVSTAVEWAIHHPNRKSCDFNGDANFTRFVELAQKLNLFVIVRAGPFIGVDRNLGGVPGWILTQSGLKDYAWIQRSSPEYRLYAESWLSYFLPKLSKMMVMNGGPVIMVQIDSDLGDSNPCSTNDWLQAMYKLYLGEKAVLFTMDNNKHYNLKCGRIQNTISAFRTDPYEYIKNFSQSAPKLFSSVKNISPNSPKLVELRTGMAWNWNGQRLLIETEDFIYTLKELIDYDASIIIYMFAGGTNFERAGRSKYTMGMTTSYDFDAVISESGDITKKFSKLTSVIPVADFTTLYDDASDENDSVRGSYDLYGTLTFSSLGSLLDEEVRNRFQVRGVESLYPLPFTQLGVSNGLVLYKTTIPADFKSTESVYLHSVDVSDRGYVYINNILVGILDNTLEFSMKIAPRPGSTIQILVENHGYEAQSVIGEPKGIISNVTLGKQVLTKWMMYALSLDDVKHLQDAAKSMQPKKRLEEGNSFLLATFRAPKDMNHATDHTYLDMTKKSFKGQAFLNERSLGKYWAVGPQKDLYLPGCHLKPHPMENRLLIVSMQRKKMYFDEPESQLKMRSLLIPKNKALMYEEESLTVYIILFYLYSFWRSGYAFLCS
ncbi:beta-galactosidase-like [Belonocnema kinseyi]|uniref:beta-galactosidase-like n=1 Tax=Belonocnema kinseyi TaxID=2817044 RepID=UPI00143D6FB1|nr:beta-galactosidase-like [Belonocnema kinseyi]